MGHEILGPERTGQSPAEQRRETFVGVVVARGSPGGQPVDLDDEHAEGVVVAAGDRHHALDGRHDRAQVGEARGRFDVGGLALRAAALQAVSHHRAHHRRHGAARHAVVHAGVGGAAGRAVGRVARDEHHARGRHVPFAAQGPRQVQARAAGARLVDDADVGTALHHRVPHRFGVFVGFDDRADVGELSAHRGPQPRVGDADHDGRRRGLAAAQHVGGLVDQGGRRDRPRQRAGRDQRVRARAFEQRGPGGERRDGGVGMRGEQPVTGDGVGVAEDVRAQHDDGGAIVERLAEVADHLGAPAAHRRLDRQFARQRLVVVDHHQVRRLRATGRRERFGRRQRTQRGVQRFDDLRQPQGVGGAEQRAGVEQARCFPRQAGSIARFHEPQRGGELVRFAGGAPPRPGVEPAFERGQGGVFERRRARGERRRVGQPDQRRRGVADVVGVVDGRHVDSRRVLEGRCGHSPEAGRAREGLGAGRRGGAARGWGGVAV